MMLPNEFNGLLIGYLDKTEPTHYILKLMLLALDDVLSKVLTMLSADSSGNQLSLNHYIKSVAESLKRFQTAVEHG